MHMKKPILLTLLLCSILQAQAATPENTTTSAVTVLRQAYDAGLATYPEVLQEEISALEAEFFACTDTKKQSKLFEVITQRYMEAGRLAEAREKNGFAPQGESTRIRMAMYLFILSNPVETPGTKTVREANETAYTLCKLAETRYASGLCSYDEVLYAQIQSMLTAVNAYTRGLEYARTEELEQQGLKACQQLRELAQKRYQQGLITEEQSTRIIALTLEAECCVARTFQKDAKQAARLQAELNKLQNKQP